MRRPPQFFPFPRQILHIPIEIQIEISQILFWTSPDELDEPTQELKRNERETKGNERNMKANERDIAPKIWTSLNI